MTKIIGSNPIPVFIQNETLPIQESSSDSPLKAVLYGDGDGLPLLLDTISGSDVLVTLEGPHHNVHAGLVFNAEHSVATLANGASLDLLLTIPAGVTNGLHFASSVNAGGQAQLYMYENPDASGGTTVAVYNMKRGDTTTPAPYSLTHTPVIGVGGVGSIALINGRLLAGGASQQTRIGGEARQGTEWLLAGKYLFRITNTSGGNISVSINFTAYAYGYNG